MLLFWMEIKNPQVLKLKGILFFILGLLAAGLLFIQLPTWENAILLLIAMWAFCRFYYFAFYVLHHYADPNFKYTGLLDLVRYLLRGKEK